VWLKSTCCTDAADGWGVHAQAAAARGNESGQLLACRASKQRHSTPACKAGHARKAVGMCEGVSTGRGGAL
jgi:hypothetical protein